MGILRSDRVSGLGGANAINGSTFFGGSLKGGSYLRVDVGSTTDFTFGTGDFTIEFWVYPQSITHQQHFFDNRGTTNTNTLLLYMTSTGLVRYYGSGASRIEAGSSLTVGTWTHVALVRSSGSTKLYFNGTQTGSTYSDSINLVAAPEGSAYIGSNGGTNGKTPTDGGFFDGYLSNFRIVKGTAVYTAAFTSPTTRLTNIDGTVLLTCQSPGNVEKTEGGNAVLASSWESGSPPPKASHIAPDVGEDHGTTFADNTKFDTLSYMVPPGGTTAESNRGRALIMGGGSSPGSNNQTAIQYFNIQSLGNTQYFGALTVARRALQSVGSSTRGVALGGIVHPTVLDTIDYVTFATQSNAIDFGNLTSSGYAAASASNNTRGIWAGGYRPNNSAVVNSIDYITIATAGNAADFGDLTAPQRAISGGSNTTRAVFGGGAYPAVVDTIAYVTIASTGNATDFGNLTDARDYAAAGSSPTRTCFAGGRDPSNTNIIDYITTASTGNAIDFGDLITAEMRGVIMSNSSRGVIGSDGSITNALDYITFATTGNSLDFGDQASSGEAPVVYSFGGCSDSHGGIS